MMKQRGFTAIEFGVVMALIFLFAVVAFGKFWDRKFDCDKRHPDDVSAAFKCLHQEQ